MSVDTVFRSVLYGFLIVMFAIQVYLAYRLRQSRKRAGSDATPVADSSMSPKASFRFALFHVAFQVFLIVWAGYGVWTGTWPWFLALGLAVFAIGWIRKPLAMAKDNHPVAIPFSVNLLIQPPLAGSVTPEYVAGVLQEESVINAIKGDLQRTGQIGRREPWRLGVITPERDGFDPRVSQLPRAERLKRFLAQRDLGFAGLVPVEMAAVLHSTGYFGGWFNNLVINRGLSWKGYRLSKNARPGDFTRIREIQLSPWSAGDKSWLLPQFLRQSGFPLRDAYADGDPLTTERGGTIVDDGGVIKVIYPRYFAQRRLIDDEGNLIYLGLDESSERAPISEVEMKPSVSRRLYRAVHYHELVPIVRYRSFPYASDYMLPLVDTPMSDSGWADLFIDPRGRARLFVSKEKTLAEWCEMMETLKQLFYSALADANYRLLGLTKDQSRLNDYMARKQAVLEDYFVIGDFMLS